MSIVNLLIIIIVALGLPFGVYYATTLIYKKKIKDNFNKIRFENEDVINEAISKYKIKTDNKNDYLEFCTRLNNILRSVANYELGNNFMKVKIVFGGYSYEKIYNHLAIECTVSNCNTKKNSNYESVKKYMYYVSNLINSEVSDLHCQTIIIEK